jgi:hypothetical protein
MLFFSVPVLSQSLPEYSKWEKKLTKTNFLLNDKEVELNITDYTNVDDKIGRMQVVSIISDEKNNDWLITYLEVTKGAKTLNGYFYEKSDGKWQVVSAFLNMSLDALINSISILLVDNYKLAVKADVKELPDYSNWDRSKGNLKANLNGVEYELGATVYYKSTTIQPGIVNYVIIELKDPKDNPWIIFYSIKITVDDAGIEKTKLFNTLHEFSDSKWNFITDFKGSTDLRKDTDDLLLKRYSLVIKW